MNNEKIEKTRPKIPIDRKKEKVYILAVHSNGKIIEKRIARKGKTACIFYGTGTVIGLINNHFITSLYYMPKGRTV